MSAETLREVLGWCCVINYSLLLFWVLVFRLAHDWIYALHGRWFNLSQKKFDAIHYALLGYFKLTVFVFNLVPYIALRITGDCCAGS